MLKTSSSLTRQNGAIAERWTSRNCAPIWQGAAPFGSWPVAFGAVDNFQPGRRDQVARRLAACRWALHHVVEKTLGRLAEEPDEDERWRIVNELSEVMNLAVVRLPGETPSDTAQQIAPAMFDEIQNETSELDAPRAPARHETAAGVPDSDVPLLP